MDADDDPSPLDLEKLLSSSPVDLTSQAVPKCQEIENDCFHTKLAALLAAVPKNDPLLTTNARSKPCLPRLEGEPFTVQAIQGKGMGAIASRRISRGSIILNDPFVVSVQEPTEDVFPKYETNGLLRQMLLQLLDQYVQLPMEKREQLASLHPHIESGSREWFREQLWHASAELTDTMLEFLVRLYYTFNTNEFSKTEPGRCGIWTVRRLFLVTARINHSCCPNARSRQTTDGYKVVTAMRDIEEGEEITLKYLDHARFSRQDWRAITQRTWGFVCDCAGCRSNMGVI